MSGRTSPAADERYEVHAAIPLVDDLIDITCDNLDGDQDPPRLFRHPAVASSASGHGSDDDGHGMQMMGAA